MRKLITLASFLNILIANNLTIYNNNFASYSNNIDFNITKQKFTLYYKDFPKTILIDSIYPKFSQNIKIISQVVSIKQNLMTNLLKSNLNKKVEFFENRFSKKTKSGVLISIDPIVIKSNDKYFIIKDSSRLIYSFFPKINNSYIKWNLFAKDSTNKARLKLSYQFSGIKWSSNYIATLNKKNLNLLALAKIENTTNKDFKDINLTLIAGDINKNIIQKHTLYKSSTKALAMSVAPQIKPNISSLDGFYKYKFKIKEDILKGKTTYLPLLDNKKLPYKKYYIAYNSNFNNYGIRKLNFTQIIEFKNKLNIPLPSGKVKLYKDNSFIGEDYINNVSKNDIVKLKTAVSFDIKGEKKIIKFISKEHYKYIKTKYLIYNKSLKGVTIKIKESLPRYGNKINLQTTCKDICKRVKDSAFLQTYIINLDANSSYNFSSSFEINF